MHGVIGVGQDGVLNLKINAVLCFIVTFSGHLHFPFLLQTVFTEIELLMALLLSKKCNVLEEVKN